MKLNDSEYVSVFLKKDKNKYNRFWYGRKSHQFVDMGYFIDTIKGNIINAGGRIFEVTDIGDETKMAVRQIKGDK